MIADKGFSVEKVFRHNTEHGVATIVRRKESGGDFKRHDKDTHDRHGIPRCRHCGATTNFVRFASHPKPRIWFRCQLGQGKGCSKTQTISCSKDYRLLIPLWRTDALYHELRISHEHYETAHNLWRSRYRVAPDDLGIRPKRRGIRWQQLRASPALVVEWLRICAGQGWLVSARSTLANGVRRENWKHGGMTAADSLNGYRAYAGVSEPYGKQAEKLGIGKLLPPSRRKPTEKADNGDPRAGPLLL